MAEEGTFSYDAMGFNSNLDVASMAASLYYNLMNMHLEGRDQAACKMFRNELPWFISIVDSIFLKNCAEIEETIDADASLTSIQKEEIIYRLQIGEFSRLLLRSGYLPKPDIRIHYNAPWDVPKDLKRLHFKGRRDVSETAKKLLEEEDGVQ